MKDKAKKLLSSGLNIFLFWIALASLIGLMFEAAKIPYNYYDKWINNLDISLSYFALNVFGILLVFYLFHLFLIVILSSGKFKEIFHQIAPKKELENINNFFFRLTVFLILYVFIFSLLWFHDTYQSVYPLEDEYPDDKTLTEFVVETRCISQTGKLDYVIDDDLNCTLSFSEVKKSNHLTKIIVIYMKSDNNISTKDRTNVTCNLFNDTPCIFYSTIPENTSYLKVYLHGEGFNENKTLTNFYIEPITWRDYRERQNERFAVFGIIFSIVFVSLLNIVKVLRDIIENKEKKTS